MKAKELTMENGNKIPIIGFGTYMLNINAVYPSVRYALECGYRHLDTAKWYHNEELVGQAILDSKVKREDIFITCKIEANGYEQAFKDVEDTLRKFHTNYLDLILIHWPTQQLFETYRALERLYDMKIAKSIGISNFNEDLCDKLLEVCRIKPQVNQIETHIYFQEKKMNKYLKKVGIIHEGWAPFAEGYMNMLHDETIEKLGKKYNKSPAQIMLRYWTQKNIIVLPKSNNFEHIKENLDIFDFKIEKDDMNIIESLDKRKQYSGWPQNMLVETYY